MFSIATSSLRRAAIVPASTIVARRQLSTTCAQSVHKLQDILEEYRVKNYSQEFPKRFQKDVVKAACTVSSSTAPPLLLLNTSTPAVSAEGIEHVLRNIGMGNRMSRSEIEAILSEVGACPVASSSSRRSSSSSSCVISADQMLSLLSTTNWEEDAASNNLRSMKHARA